MQDTNKNTDAANAADIEKKVHELPTVVVKGNTHGLRAGAAKLIAGELAKTGRFFMNGDALMELVVKGKKHELRPATAKRLAYLIEKYTKPVALKAVKDSAVTVPTQCGQGFASSIMETDEFHELLHSIQIISPCPLLIKHEGKLELVAQDKVVGDVFAHGEAPPEPETVKEAKQILDKVLVDFDFVSDGDRSRAYAALIVPSLVMGGLLEGRATIDLIESNESQSGKGYWNKMKSAIYNQQSAVINFGQRGLGSAERSFNCAVVAGHGMILFDNCRGHIESQQIESFLTEDSYQAAVPHCPDVTIDPTRTVVSMTTNEASLNKDLAYRTAPVRIKKREKGYGFERYENDGFILDHIRLNQPVFLGAVFRIVREWYSNGGQVDPVAAHAHDFSRWAGVMNYIVKDILCEADMFAGYDDVKKMLYTPNQSWLREVSRALLENKDTSASMQTGDILKELEELGLERLIPGLKDYETLDMGNCLRKCSTLAGRKLSPLFRGTGDIVIEGIRIKRTVESKPRIEIDAEGKSVNRGDRETPCYSFEVVKG
ncbi:hypothetical protein PDESU_00421 [Pontiella desulfatans]|uniref:Uncharacterized protein n=1 Tax=Pontiella desulfatans TaxID=2750659 RepID=A0A6C2TWJ8_PONDE|nr:hypothetical protein [Pontiella desulfatans]VGO11874.1 hypothetical protein PDESU_00421 [Pontiella desulfatans]